MTKRAPQDSTSQTPSSEGSKDSQAKERKFRLGLVVNPFAGIGGALALKGSDGKHIRQQALDCGAEQLAMEKAQRALEHVLSLKDDIQIFCASGDMGASLAQKLGFSAHIVYELAHAQTEAEDTIKAIDAIMMHDIDLLLFAGGDGTARNVYSAVGNSIPVLGVPAGCKIHSGVYAITPSAAGKVLAKVVRKELLSLFEAEVKDIDEAKFRKGEVIAKYFGEMLVPEELNYIQAVKMGGKESDELVLNDIAAYISEMMEDEPERIFVMGSGSTVDFIMQSNGLANTLLGVDIVQNMQVIASDVSAKDLESIAEKNDISLVITLIGGQGHILGRGNQQLSPKFIRRVGKQNIHVVATKGKLQALGNKGLISDTTDLALNQSLSGPIPVITGYKDKVLYFVRGEEDEYA